MPSSRGGVGRRVEGVGDTRKQSHSRDKYLYNATDFSPPHVTNTQQREKREETTK